jgi:solute:Na+ symporter, SSS family
VQFILFLVVGVLLYVFAQHAPLLAAGERTDRVLPLFLAREMPVGLAGLMLASIIAVAMSNASGCLNSMAASSILDFSAAAGWRQESSRFLAMSRRMTLAWGVVLMALGFVFMRSNSRVLETGLTVTSFPFGSLLGLFLLGTLDNRANTAGALTGMFVGLAATAAVWKWTSVAYTWYYLIGSCVTFLAGALVSRVVNSDRPMSATSAQRNG